MKSSVYYLGHVIYPRKLAVRNRTLEAISGMKPWVKLLIWVIFGLI